MTFQTSLSQVPEEQLAHLSSELITPLGDALLSQSKLTMMDWLLGRLSFAAKVDEEQLGRPVSTFRGPVHHLAPTSRSLTLAEALQQVREAGVEGRVKVFEGQREGALKLEIDREQTKQKYERIVAHADQGWGTQFLIGATGVAVDFADPVNLATMTVPGAGAGKVFYGLTKATVKLAPVASKIIVRAGTGAYEGAVSTALAEPLNYAVHQSLGDEYGLGDSVSNIVTNAVGGAALQVLGGARLDLYRGMRVRADVGPEGTIRVVGGGAQQIGSLEPVNVSGLVGQGQAALTRPSPAPSPVVRPSDEKTKGLGYARDAILVMPASGSSGNRVTDGDLVGLKNVLSDYDPVVSANGEGASAGSAADVFRIKRDADVIVYTRSPAKKGSPETFTVERVRTDDLEHAAALSQRKAAITPSNGKAEDYVLYFHPPKALSERFAETFAMTLTEMEKLTPKELYMRFRPSEAKGQTIDTGIGQALHRTYKDYTMASTELRISRQKNRARPDSGLADDELNVDLKRDSQRGRKSGQESWHKYWKRLNQSTAILLYDEKLYVDRIAALEEKVVAAWKKPEASWHAEREARTAAAKRKKGAKPKNDGTSKTSGASPNNLTRKERKKSKPGSPDLPNLS